MRARWSRVVWDVEHVNLLVEMLTQRKMQVGEHPDLVLWIPIHNVDVQVAFCQRDVDIDIHAVVHVAFESFEREP